LTENVAFLIDFDPNLTVFNMDGWPYAVVDNSQKPGTGNGEQGTGNLGTPITGEECIVQNAQYATIRAARRDGGTQARRDGGEGRGNCQNGRRRPTAGNRDSGLGDPDLDETLYYCNDAKHGEAFRKA